MYIDKNFEFCYHYLGSRGIEGRGEGRGALEREERKRLVQKGKRENEERKRTREKKHRRRVKPHNLHQ